MSRLIIFIICVFTIACSSVEDNLEPLKQENIAKGNTAERVEAIYWLHENTEGEQTKKLLKRSLEKDPSPAIRALSIRLMVLSDDKEYLPLIIKAIEDQDYSVRMEAVQAIGSFQAIEEQNKLIELVEKDPHVWVKLKALKSIGYMEAKETVPGLMKSLKSQEHSVQLQIVILLEKFTGQKFGFDFKAWDKWYEGQQVSGTS